MPKPKINMPKDLKAKCHVIIHAASTTAAASAAVSIPVQDHVVITATQVTMIVALGNAFGVTIKESVANSIASCGLAQTIGRTISATVLKSIPVINVTIAPVANAAIASVITELLGWMIADDFYRISVGEEPENLVKGVEEIKDLFGKQFSSFSENKNGSKTKGTSLSRNKKK